MERARAGRRSPGARRPGFDRRAERRPSTSRGLLRSAPRGTRVAADRAGLAVEGPLRSGRAVTLETDGAHVHVGRPPSPGGGRGHAEGDDARAGKRLTREVEDLDTGARGERFDHGRAGARVADDHEASVLSSRAERAGHGLTDRGRRELLEALGEERAVLTRREDPAQVGAAEEDLRAIARAALDLLEQRRLAASKRPSEAIAAEPSSSSTWLVPSARFVSGRAAPSQSSAARPRHRA